MKQTHSYRFDAETHTYYITTNGIERKVPGVTSVLWDLLPGWRASEFYLNKGSCVHACCALIGQGKTFEHDPAIDGQVRACRAFYKDTGLTPLAVERQVYSVPYQYGGTLDLEAMFCGHLTILDWKAGLADSVKYQLVGYSLAEGKATHGMGVELRDDGTYRISELWDLRRLKSDWLCLLRAYQIRRQANIKEEDRT